MTTADTWATKEIPLIISVDDHVLEPPDLWSARLPAHLRSEGPRVERTSATAGKWEDGALVFVETADHPEAVPADVWIYEDSRVLIKRGYASVGVSRDQLDHNPLTFESMRPGCYQVEARLEDMDANHTEASLCFPTIARFCGQFFMNRQDVDLALRCVRTYNDWMIDEWSGGAREGGKGRLIPLTLIPLWDSHLAAEEIRRCAAKGSHAVAFSESPTQLGLPSLFSGKWDPFLAACDETDTVVNMHIGSSSKLPTTAVDAPHIVTSALTFQNGMHALIDWIVSGTLERFPNMRIALSEAQIGWLPFVLERLDYCWTRNEAADRLRDSVPNLPSSYIADRVFGCIFDDLEALRNRDVIGMSQIMFETDYPHSDSTWDYSVETARRLAVDAGLTDDEIRQLVRGNAIRCYGLDKYLGIES